MKALECPHCAATFDLRGEVPPLPEALFFDCPHCTMAFVVWRNNLDIKVTAATRTGQATA